MHDNTAQERDKQGSLRYLPVLLGSLRHLSEYDGTYGEIYPMHGSFPVSPELVGKLITGAEEIRAGKAEGKAVDMFGTEVTLYKFPYAGFLMKK